MPSKKTPYIKVKGKYYEVTKVSQRQLSIWSAEAEKALPVGGEFDVGYADPPWLYKSGSYAKDGHSLDGLATYPVVDLERLKQLPVRKCFARNSILFLWVTCPLIADGLELLKAYGFQLSTVGFVWQKVYSNDTPVLGCGRWTRPSVELCLIGKSGTGLTKWITSHSAPQVWRLPRSKVHSQKPAEIRDFIKSWLQKPDGSEMKRLELWARDRSPGYSAWGLELSCSNHHYYCPPPTRKTAQRTKAGGFKPDNQSLPPVSQRDFTEVRLERLDIPKELLSPNARDYTYAVECDDNDNFRLIATEASCDPS